jgi:excisionase family DNA binding protein
MSTPASSSSCGPMRADANVCSLTAPVPKVRGVKNTPPPLAHSRLEAAQMLGLSERKIDYMIQSGEIRPSRIGNRVLIPHAALLELLERNQIEVKK